jgi:O-methyltransferase
MKVLPAESPRLAAIRAGFEEARPARASGPQADADGLRAAYLDVLKLCLCDLGGSSTTSVGRTPEGLVMARELTGGELKLRAAGMDWPLHGLTMVGLRRLDDLQACVESVVADGVEGDAIEAGTWRGGASILMRATLDSLGDERTVCVADSFQGFPAADPRERPEAELDVFDFLAAPLDDVRAAFERFGCDERVRFLPGFFEETLPGLEDQRWAIIRMDGDSYEATWQTLESLYPRLAVGGYVVVDDYGALDECRDAVDEFRRHHGIGERLEHIDWTGARWRRESDASIVDPAAGRRRRRPEAPPRPAPRPAGVHVPTAEELRLRQELDLLRARLEAAEAEIGRLRESPLSGPRAWLRQKLDGS